MDSKQAQAYLIDPLNAPEPSQETGPGSHFVRPESSVSSVPSPSTNPYRKSSLSKDSGASTHVRQLSRDKASPTSSSPRSDKFPRYREEAFGALNDSPSPRRSSDGPKSPVYEGGSGRRRGSSLKERFPGDDSHKPLDMIRKDSRKAHRAPHLTKRHMPGADSIDRLDPTINKIPYHHEGPYDAASLARNSGVKLSPVAALKESNAEAIKATAGENVKDAVEKHMPLDGVAIVPPGMPDQFGRVRQYEEGTNELLEGDGGTYKRYDGVEYHPDDVKGQSEPSFSLDRALRNHSIHERNFDGQRGIELSDRPLMSDYDKSHKDGKAVDTRDPVVIAGDDGKYADLQYAADVDAHPRRKSSLREGIKRRIGSIKKKGLDEFLP